MARPGSPLLRAGLPFLALVVLGSVGLSQLLKVRRTGSVQHLESRTALTARVAVTTLQGKTEVHDARRSADDLRLPAAIRRRKGRLDLEEEARVSFVAV
jgi:Cytochrome c oxidase assembly protein COX16